MDHCGSDCCAAFAYTVGVAVSTIKVIARRAESMSRPHILVVNDSQLVRNFSEMILTDKGYRVTTAADGQAALGAIEDETPELMILDIQMPGLDGVSVVRAMEEKDVPFLIYSVWLSDDPRVVELMALGAIGCTSPQTLLMDVGRALGSVS